jgi:hypothetical protein
LSAVDALWFLALFIASLLTTGSGGRSIFRTTDVDELLEEVRNHHSASSYPAQYPLALDKGLVGLAGVLLRKIF